MQGLGYNLKPENVLFFKSPVEKYVLSSSKSSDIASQQPFKLATTDEIAYCTA